MCKVFIYKNDNYLDFVPIFVPIPLQILLICKFITQKFVYVKNFLYLCAKIAQQ